jgi:hypothetical protein
MVSDLVIATRLNTLRPSQSPPISSAQLGADRCSENFPHMTKIVRYAIYPPAGPGTPWLAVVLDEDKVVEAVACEDRVDAAQVVLELQSRAEGRAFRRNA